MLTPMKEKMKLIDKDIQNRVENNAEKLEEIVNDIVDKYTDKLDAYMKKIHTVLTEEADELTEQELCKIMIVINSYSYFLGTKCELAGIKQDVSEMVYSEKYNHEFLVATGTINAKNATATLNTVDEDVIKIIYARVYKILKNKLDNTIRMSDGVKKIISLRVKAMELAGRSNAITG